MARLIKPPVPPTNRLKRVALQLVHAVLGHPAHMVFWGTAEEGATCACGARWTRADFCC